MKHFPVPLFVPLLLVALARCTHPDPAAQFAQAKAAFAAEDYSRARAAVLVGLDADQGNRVMLLLLVRADLALGDGDGAGRALTRLTDGAKPAQEVTELAAEAALLRGHHGEMVHEMDRLLGHDQSATAWRLRGEAAMAANDSAAALTDFKRGMGSGDFRIAADYARFLIDDDNIDEADRALKIMRQSGPNRLDTLMITGTIAQHRGQLDAAQTAFDDATKRFPARVEPLVALADLADLRGHLDQTTRYAAAARARNPGQPQVFSLTVRVAAEQGDWAKVRDLSKGAGAVAAEPVCPADAGPVRPGGKRWGRGTDHDPLAGRQRVGRAARVERGGRRGVYGARSGSDTIRGAAAFAATGRDQCLW